MRLLFTSTSRGDSLQTIPSTEFTLHSFGPTDRPLFQLELAILLLGTSSSKKPIQYAQITFNNLQSPWIPINQNNNLELHLSDVTDLSTPIIKLNDHLIHLHSESSESQAQKNIFNYEYDQTAQVPPEWSDFQTDPGFIELLTNQNNQNLTNGFSVPVWQSPLIDDHLHETKITETSSFESSSNPSESIEYLVYTDNDSHLISLNSLQITINQALPAIPKSKKMSSVSSRFLFSFFKSTYSTKINSKMEILMISSSRPNQRIYTASVALVTTFLIYLSVLIYFSKMTSIRRNHQRKANRGVDDVSMHPSKSIAELQTPANEKEQTHSLSKSPSKTLHLDFNLPDGLVPQLKSFSTSTESKTSNSNSVLKLSLTLSDNRHILFPSKLRNFQK